MSWSNPMPRRMGGRGRAQIEDLEATSRANSGSLLFGDASTEIGLHHRVVARMIALGFRAARSRAVQADPRRLSDAARAVSLPDGTTQVLSPLQRWEATLRLRPSANATETERRAAVAERRRATGQNTIGAVRAMLEGVFGDWTVTLYTKRAADLTALDANWPLGANTPAYPGSAPSGTLTWYSEVCGLYFGVTAPAGADEGDKARRMKRAVDLLDLIAPAHANVAGAYE